MGGERYILTCKVDEQIVVQEIVDSEFLKRGYSIESPIECMHCAERVR